MYILKTAWILYILPVPAMTGMPGFRYWFTTLQLMWLVCILAINAYIWQCADSLHVSPGWSWSIAGSCIVLYDYTDNSHIYISGMYINIYIDSGLNANSKWYWPCRTSNTKYLLVLQKIYWSYKYFFNIKRKKHCIKFTDNIYFYLFYLHLFQKHLGYSWGETC